jgi:hypothetical protein
MAGARAGSTSTVAASTSSAPQAKARPVPLRPWQTRRATGYLAISGRGEDVSLGSSSIRPAGPIAGEVVRFNMLTYRQPWTGRLPPRRSARFYQLVQLAATSRQRRSTSAAAALADLNTRRPCPRSRADATFGLQAGWERPPRPARPDAPGRTSLGLGGRWCRAGRARVKEGEGQTEPTASGSNRGARHHAEGQGFETGEQVTTGILR